MESFPNTLINTYGFHNDSLREIKQGSYVFDRWRDWGLGIKYCMPGDGENENYSVLITLEKKLLRFIKYVRYHSF